MSENPPIHVLIAGDSGAGKTRMAATFPKPMIVYFFDGFGNDQPYLDQGELAPLKYARYGDQYADTPIREVLDKEKGELLIQIRYYNDADPEKPDAFERFLIGLNNLDPSAWATIALDSFTYAEMSARWFETFVNYPEAKGQAKQQWWGESANSMERIICGRFRGFLCNTAVTAHINMKTENVRGEKVWGVQAPGRLSTSLPGAFSEVYCLHVQTDQEGKSKRVLQTQKDEQYFAKTHINAPNLCKPSYEALWGGKR